MKSILKIFDNKPLHFLIGLLGGAISGLYPKYTVFCLLIIVIIYMVILVWIHIRKTNQQKVNIQYTKYESTILNPTKEAKYFEERTGVGKLVVGTVIEYYEHNFLNSKVDINEIGWDPKDVKINQGSKFNHSVLFNALNKTLDIGKQKDNPKFCLSHLEKSPVDNDDKELQIDVKETSYLTIRNVLDDIINRPDLRLDYGNIEPAKNLIPNSLCLHYIVELVDQNVILYQRAPCVDYYPMHFSFSGEEQINRIDLEDENIESLFQRALTEEIFPLTEKNIDEMVEAKQNKKMWDYISPLVENMKIWSFFYEEELSNFSMLGYIKLNITRCEFLQKYNSLKAMAVGHRDNEGLLYYTNNQNIEKLLFEGQCTVYNLFSNIEVKLNAKRLHPTSRYRMFRYVRAKKKDALSFNEYLEKNAR